MYPRIRDLREDNDMSQTELAKKLEMSQTGYSKYETGENDIPTSILIKLADLLICEFKVKVIKSVVCENTD